MKGETENRFVFFLTITKIIAGPFPKEKSLSILFHLIKSCFQIPGLLTPAGEAPP